VKGPAPRTCVPRFDRRDSGRRDRGGRGGGGRRRREKKGAGLIPFFAASLDIPAIIVRFARDGGPELQFASALG